jgi:hypothetical protein
MEHLLDIRFRAKYKITRQEMCVKRRIEALSRIIIAVKKKYYLLVCACVRASVRDPGAWAC